MSIRPLVIIPDSRLRLISDPIVRVDARVRAIVEDMFETMYDAPGIGLAAIQVGIPERIVTVDVAEREDGSAEGEEPKKNPLALINPEIISSSEEISVYSEGCLSIPEYYADVERPARVKVRYMDLNGETQEIDADGLLATCVQHEIDHLNGVLFIDHISKLKRDRVMTQVHQARQAEGTRRGLSPGALRLIACRIREFSCASSSWARPTSPCRRWPRSSAAGTRWWRPIRARRRLPGGAGWSWCPRRCTARPRSSACPCSPPRPCARKRRPRPSPPMRRTSRWWSPMAASCRRSILDAPKLGCLNLHASLLPRWRGAAPIQRAIMAGDAESGVAVMKMEAGLDTGPVGLVERVAIGADMTAGELHDRLMIVGADLMGRALAALERGGAELHAAAGSGRHLRRQDRQGRDPHRLVEAGEAGA